MAAGATQPARLVEYLPGDNAASPGCPAARPTSNDATGRLRALWVSSVGGPTPGDILKLTYSWQGDQITETDTCLLGSTTPRTETFSYDATLRLTGAGRPAGNFAAAGGAFSSRTYGYDGRGNRISYVPDGIALTTGYDATRVDQLTTIGNAAAGKLWGYTFSYDADGRVTTKLGPNISTGLPASRIDYTPGPDAGGANDTVFKAVTVNGSVYNYFYDALNRRRYKSYPTGTSDEYFYDLGHQLLVDQWNSSLLPASAVPVIDEYIWLGGRAVALIRSNLTSTYLRGGGLRRGAHPRASREGRADAQADGAEEQVAALRAGLPVRRRRSRSPCRTQAGSDTSVAGGRESRSPWHFSELPDKP